MIQNIRNKLEFSEVISNKIKPLCDPIERVFGIPLFGYRKFFPNGESFNISSSPTWNRFVQEKFYNKIVPNYEEEVRLALKSDKYFVLRVGNPDPNDSYLTALYECDIWNTLSLYRKNQDYLEGFYFTSTRNNFRIVEEYINNIALFERFTLYFKEKFKDILSDEQIKKESTLTISPSIFKEKREVPVEESALFQSFISDIVIEKLFLNINGKEVPLSSQEFKCLAWLSRGKTAKEVARMMGLSPRTVESYMDNVKFKTRIDSRSKLIDLFILNFSQDRDLLKYIESKSKGSN